MTENNEKTIQYPVQFNRKNEIQSQYVDKNPDHTDSSYVNNLFKQLQLRFGITTEEFESSVNGLNELKQSVCDKIESRVANVRGSVRIFSSLVPKYSHVVYIRGNGDSIVYEQIVGEISEVLTASGLELKVRKSSQE